MTLEAVEHPTPPRDVTPAPEDTLEPALRAVLDTSGASAGALCLFDREREVLRLAAEVGLSDDGCRQLRTLSRAAASCWQLPLDSLFARRIRTLESDADVPPLVDPAPVPAAVACVPLFSNDQPFGVVVLVGGDPDAAALADPLRALAAVVDAIHRRRAPAAASTGWTVDSLPLFDVVAG